MSGSVPPSPEAVPAGTGTGLGDGGRADGMSSSSAGEVAVGTPVLGAGAAAPIGWSVAPDVAPAMLGGAGPAASTGDADGLRPFDFFTEELKDLGLRSGRLPGALRLEALERTVPAAAPCCAEAVLRVTRRPVRGGSLLSATAEYKGTSTFWPSKTGARLWNGLLSSIDMFLTRYATK